MAKNIEVTLTLDNSQFKKSIQQSKAQVKGFETDSIASAGLIRNAFIALGGGAVIRSIGQTGAAFQDLQNSLNVVFGGVEEGAAAFQRVQDFASTTQFSVQTLTQAFVQLKGAGVEPTEELLQTFADTASVTTDQMGTFQAALDLVSRSTAGGLGLEDLNRLADRGIPVFRILEERLGRSRLELSEFGKTAEGADQIISALLAGLQEDFGGALAGQFGLINFELNQLGDAFDKLQNAIFQTFSDDAATAIQGLTAAINNFADNTEGINTVLTVLGAALEGLVGVFLLLKVGVKDTLGNFERFTTALLTASGGVIVAIISRFKDLGLALRLLGGTLAGLILGRASFGAFAVALGAVGAASAPVIAIIGAVTLALDALFRLFNDGNGIIGTFKQIFATAPEPVEELKEEVEETNEVIEENEDKLDRAAIAAEAFKKGYDNAKKSVKEFKQEIFDSNDPLSNYQEFLSKIIGESNALAVEQVFAGRAIQFINDLYDQGAIATRTYGIAIEKLNSILGIEKDELSEGEEAFKSFNERIETGAETLTEYFELQRQLQALIEKYPELFDEAAEATDNLDDALAKNEGVASFLSTLGRAQKALSEDLATALVEGKSASEAFQQFFKKLVVQLIADALRLAIIQPILGSLFGISFGAGGAVSGLTGGGLFGFLGGRANGGPVMKNKPYIVGERGPELFVPGQSGGIVPNEALGMGGGTTVNYNIQAVDAQSFQALVARDPEFIFAVTEAGRRRLPQ